LILDTRYEGRGRKEDGRQRTEDGGQKTDSNAGCWMLDAGYLMLDTSAFAESYAFTKGYGGQAILDAPAKKSVSGFVSRRRSGLRS